MISERAINVLDRPPSALSSVIVLLTVQFFWSFKVLCSMIGTDDFC